MSFYYYCLIYNINCPSAHLSVLTLAVPAWVQVGHTCTQRGGNSVACLSVIL